ncbi:MAG: hypothetical protein WCW67_03405 [Candidatus Margulisiibacteriota bacterium]
MTNKNNSYMTAEGIVGMIEKIAISMNINKERILSSAFVLIVHNAIEERIDALLTTLYLYPSPLILPFQNGILDRMSFNTKVRHLKDTSIIPKDALEKIKKLNCLRNKYIHSKIKRISINNRNIEQMTDKDCSEIISSFISVMKVLNDHINMTSISYGKRGAVLAKAGLIPKIIAKDKTIRDNYGKWN